MNRLTDELEAWLPTQQEFAMGYQRAYVTLSNKSIETGIVLNSQVFLRDNEIDGQFGKDFTFLLNAAFRESVYVKSVTLIPRPPESLKGVRQIAIDREVFHILANRKIAESVHASEAGRAKLFNESRYFTALAATSGAESAPLTLTEAGEVFKRFSAFANDKRITKGWGLTSGTFATTEIDAMNIHTGADAVARYSLPNNKPASNVFTITPPSDTNLKRGTSQPANGQPGGGVEVIFVQGTPDGTVKPPYQIPDK
jgi:hypothetical protein